MTSAFWSVLFWWPGGKNLISESQRHEICFLVQRTTLQKLSVRLWPCKNSLRPMVIYSTDCSMAILMWWFLLFYVLQLNVYAVCTLHVYALSYFAQKHR